MISDGTFIMPLNASPKFQISAFGHATECPIAFNSTAQTVICCGSQYPHHRKTQRYLTALAAKNRFIRTHPNYHCKQCLCGITEQAQSASGKQCRVKMRGRLLLSSCKRKSKHHAPTHKFPRRNDRAAFRTEIKQGDISHGKFNTDLT